MNLRILNLFILPFALAVAAEPDNAQLQQLLKRYPDADTNHDGVLTPDEAQAYARTVKRGKAKAGAEGKQRAAIPRPPPTHADVGYGPHERNKLDLWLAKSDRPTPLVVFIHGGGFTNGSKAGADAGMIRGCLDAGVSFMAINYRYRTGGVSLAEILRDCARSIQFVRFHANDYNLDPARVASYGGSAGAGTSLWLAFHPDLADPKSSDPVLRESSRLVAAGAMNPQATYKIQEWESFLGKFDPAWGRGTEVEQAGKEPAEESARQALNDLSMLQLASKDDPPVFLFNSQPDGPAANRGHYVHHPNHVRALKKRCDEVGIPATVFFAMAEPHTDGDHLAALREFFFQQFKVGTAKPR